ncbi:MAG TPA: acyl-CoA synthetase [Herbaspirillum sp.]|uniref:acyl-CoA synthetase n=1 Tax=Herbaspirillum sp. TaxID=1890675 RepID=UPI002D4A7FEF|nr:acyl-CoA synthetase [Herbaspirillum sp.]HZG21060.1 acyl-CoA synthetase [Herbaspirillum sp.]
MPPYIPPRTAITAAHYRQDAPQHDPWQIPEWFNIGIAACDRWADGSGRPAIISEEADGSVSTWTFDQLKTLSDQFAQALTEAGIGRGDRIGIYLSQRIETVITHIAAYKLGAITVPLFYLFGPEAIAYRLNDSEAAALVTDGGGMDKVHLAGELPALKVVFCVEQSDIVLPQTTDFWDRLHAAAPLPQAVATRADDPAMIIYTSGTTGKAKGALHAHRVLLGHLPGVEVSHDSFPQPGDRFWTPADWAWIGGLLDVLLPSLYHGVAVVARRLEKFDAQAVFGLLARHDVRNVFFPPTALKMLRGTPAPREQWHFTLRSVASGGETLGDDLIAWGREALGVTINEFYGQTECNLVVSSSSRLYPSASGSMGRAVPGHDVQVVDEEGRIVPRGSVGNIAIRAPDPVMFLGYWRNEEATRDKFAGAFLLTGDLGNMDEQGYIRYLGRNDDVITSAGYRIGPAPIEECLMRHPAVRIAAVVGVKDEVRTEVVKAFVVLREGHAPGQALVAELQQHVRAQLAAHEYPRLIAFVDALPTTATGKIMRKTLKEMDP